MLSQTVGKIVATQFAKIGAFMAGPPEFDHYELSVETSAGGIDA